MDPAANVLFSHVTSAALVVWIIQVLKNAKWFPLLHNNGQVVLKRVISVLGAFTAHTAIAYTWHTSSVNGAHVLTILIPAWHDLAVSVWRWVGQYVMQEGWYQAIYNKLSVPGAPTPLPAPIQGGKPA